MGLTYVELKDKNKAFQMFKKAIDNDPKMEDALINISAAAYELDKTPEAIKYIDEVIKSNPNHSLAYKLKGLYLTKKKDPEAANCITKAKELESVKAITPNKYVQELLSSV
jgi:tetratricopeptide (TPR) repeat protein